MNTIRRINMNIIRYQTNLLECMIIQLDETKRVKQETIGYIEVHHF